MEDDFRWAPDYGRQVEKTTTRRPCVYRIAGTFHEQAMPVLLMTAEDVDRWLNGNSVDDAPAMQRPAPDDALEVGPPVKPEKKAA